MAEVCKDPKEASEASVSSENQKPKSGHSAGGETEDGEMSMETQRKLMELLCEEAYFLMDDKLLTLLAPLEKEKQTVVKLDSLLCILGLGEQDVPSLAHFLFEYDRQQREQMEDVCVESGKSSDKAEEVETKSTTDATSGLIARNHVVPALKSFLQQHRRSKESAARHHRSFHVAARHTSETKAYWKSIGNIMYESKVKLCNDAD